MPDIEEKRMSPYPEPNTPGWEDAYRAAYAKDSVYTDFMNTLVSWGKEADDIESNEHIIDKHIV